MNPVRTPRFAPACLPGLLGSAALVAGLCITSHDAVAQTADRTTPDASTEADTPATTDENARRPGPARGPESAPGWFESNQYGFPEWFRHTYRAAMRSPLPAGRNNSTPGGSVWTTAVANGAGMLGVGFGSDAGNLNNAFFQSLGTNGRSCFSCHRPGNAMSITTENLQNLWNWSGGRDPVFAPVDGANCPSSVARGDTRPSPFGGVLGLGGNPGRAAHSLLLNRGLFRIFLPLPAQTPDLQAAGGPAPHAREFDIEVLRDPNGCNTEPAYARQVDPATGETTQIVSVYRRPRMSANLNAALATPVTQGPGAVLPHIDLVTGVPVSFEGRPVSGNVMWDGREPSLESQARNATLGHAQARIEPTPAQIEQMVRFERNVFVAQNHLWSTGALSGWAAGGGRGGPAELAATTPAFGALTVYDSWQKYAGLQPWLDWTIEGRRGSIARGQTLFNTRSFQVRDVAGFNDARFAGIDQRSAPGTCATCHGNLPAGSDPVPAAQRDIGIGGHAQGVGGPAPLADLPLFRVTCRAPYTTPFNGTSVTTTDPGKALITGRCADVGRTTVPQIRGLESRAPFFSNGSARTVRDIVEFYDRRFSMGLTARDKQDLTAFLSAL